MSIALRQSYLTSNNGVASVSTTISVVAGDLIVVARYNQNGLDATSTCNDGTNTYTKQTGGNFTNVGCSIDFFYTIATATNASLSVTTNSPGGNTGDTSQVIHVVSGIARAGGVVEVTY